MVPGNGFQNHLQGRVREAYPPSIIGNFRLPVMSFAAHFFYGDVNPTCVFLLERTVELLPLSFFGCSFFFASAFRPVWPGRCDLSFSCIPQSARALDQGGVEPRQAVSPKALRPWTIPLRYSVGFIFWMFTDSSICSCNVLVRYVLRGLAFVWGHCICFLMASCSCFRGFGFQSRCFQHAFYESVAASDLLWTPLASCKARQPLHWTHAWALLW